MQCHMCYPATTRFQAEAMAGGNSSEYALDCHDKNIKEVRGLHKVCGGGDRSVVVARTCANRRLMWTAAGDGIHSTPN